jgi:serine/threonine protein kinase
MDWVRGETIGYGSFATVSLAATHQTHLPPLMAAKSCVVECADTLKNEKLILNEIGYCPQIIQCFGEDFTIENRGEKFYNILLEYASRGSLADLVKQTNGGLPESEVKSYTRSILKGLCFIHSKGFAHCDIKLDNILLCANGEAKIADFGLAINKYKEFNGGVINCCRGTPLYMSPESINDNLYKASGDIWGLGCAIYEMASGRTVWDNEKGWNIGSLLMKIGAGDELPGVPVGLSEEGKDFVLKCFVKDHNKRWTAEMLLNHPFVVDHDRRIVFKEEELVLNSPTSPFGFPTWSSSKTTSDWESSYSHIDSALDRIGRLSFDDQEGPNWSWNWVTVR